MDGRSVAANLEGIRARVRKAAIRAGRDPGSVDLLAVSKKQPAARVAEALASGQEDFGENYVQELLPRLREFPGARWHFIGRLQRNKCKLIAGKVKLIHSVDRAELAEEISRAAVREGTSQDLLLQVNLGSEESKGGIEPPRLSAVLEEIGPLPGIRVLGLMALPPLSEDPERARPYFKKLKEMRDQSLPGGILSMGTSHDFEVAVEEGATLVRVGAAIFGERSL
jgi:pyridoxal phosphate enzyme (YggS family)